MGKPKSVRFNQHQLDAIEDLQARGKADSDSEAHRMLFEAGMHAYGYDVRGNGNTHLKWLSKELAKLTSYIGVAWLVFFWAFPISFRMGGVFLLFMALVLTGLYVLLDAKEPAISNRLFGEREVLR